MNTSIELHPISDGETQESIDRRIDEACEGMHQIYKSGKYPELTVERTWSPHNPVLVGEVSRPNAYRWYLKRELKRLLRKGAKIKIQASRDLVDLNDPKLLEFVDERRADFTKKKLFLFSPERFELSIQRLEHYTGTSAHQFQKYILLTNYSMHMEAFVDRFPNCVQPLRQVQMPAYHHEIDENQGVSIINIGVGPSNAKNLTDHVSVLRPDAMVMVGHCGGIRNHQEIGDFVLASGYMRADHVMDEALPLNVPVAPSSMLNDYLEQALSEHQIKFRLGTVYTTQDRNWELNLKRTLVDLKQSRSLAIDMESATVAANGFRYRVPNATLLCVSDKPLHGQPKLPSEAMEFYRETQKKHVDIAIRALDLVRKDWPEGMPNSSLRSIDEPLMEGSED